MTVMRDLFLSLHTHTHARARIGRVQKFMPNSNRSLGKLYNNAIDCYMYVHITYM